MDPHFGGSVVTNVTTGVCVCVFITSTDRPPTSQKSTQNAVADLVRVVIHITYVVI